MKIDIKNKYVYTHKCDYCKKEFKQSIIRWVVLSVVV